MPGTIPCAPSCCTTTQVVNVPGSPGLPGGSGVSSFTTTTADLTVPALNAFVTIGVANSSWAAVGMNVIVGQGLGAALVNPGPANFVITAIPGSASLTLKSLQYPGDVAPGTIIGTGFNTGGAIVAPAGQALTTPIGIASGGTGQITAAAAANALSARRRILKFTGLNFNVTTDQTLAGLPASYIITAIYALNASISLTTAAGGIYTAPAKGGTVIVAAAQVYTALTAAAKYKALTLDATAGGPTTDVRTETTLYLSLTTAQGAAATGDLALEFIDLT